MTNEASNGVTADDASNKGSVKTAESHAETLGTPTWEFAAAKAANNWATGQEMTAKEFRIAVENARKERVG